MLLSRRKRSLKLHPDKGGDKQSFQCLNRAYVVLRYVIHLSLTLTFQHTHAPNRDKKRRDKYDIIGLDLDENDPSQSDAASSSNPEEGEDFIPNTLSKESEAVREVIGDFGVRFFRLCMCVILTQYMKEN